MIFLSVSHFVSDNRSEFIFVCQKFDHATINKHNVSHSAGGVYLIGVGNKIFIRQIFYRRIDCLNALAQVSHHSFQFCVVFGIGVDAHSFCKVLINRLLPLGSRIELFNIGLCLAFERRALNKNADNASDSTGIGCLGDGCSERQRHAQGRRRYRRQNFFLPIHKKHLHKKFRIIYQKTLSRAKIFSAA